MTRNFGLDADEVPRVYRVTATENGEVIGEEPGYFLPGEIDAHCAEAQAGLRANGYPTAEVVAVPL